MFPPAVSDLIAKISIGLLFSFKSKDLLMTSERKAKNNNESPNVNPEEFVLSGAFHLWVYGRSCSTAI